MNKSKYILFLIILVPIESFSQYSLTDKIFKLFPACTGFDTEIYLPKKDTCFSLLELESVDLSIGLKDVIVLENSGQKPINTSLEQIFNGKSQICESAFYSVSRYEISPRRINELRKEIKYKCIEIKEHVLQKPSLSRGLYRNCSESLYKFDDLDLFEFQKNTNGFKVNSYHYFIKQDIVMCQIKSSFIWNEIKNELIENIDISEEPNLEIEVCYLLNDCIQNHTTTLISMACWQKQFEDEDIESIIKKIKKF